MPAAIDEARAIDELLTRESVLARVPSFAPAALKVMDLLPQSDSSVPHLALSTGAANYVKAAAQTDELQRCWRHTLATATLSRELARATGLPVERAYTAGLLHDIGRLGLMATFPMDYTLASQTAGREGISLLDLERAIFGIDHCELGTHLLQGWNLPAVFERVLSGHHHPPLRESFDLLTITQLACRVADVLGYFMVPPLVPWTLDQLRAVLPDAAQSRFPAEAAALIELIERNIEQNGDGDSEEADVAEVQHGAPARQKFSKPWDSAEASAA